MSEYLAPESRWRWVAVNLRFVSRGFLFQICCFKKRPRTFQLDLWKVLISSFLSSTLSWP